MANPSDVPTPHGSERTAPARRGGFLGWILPEPDRKRSPRTSWAVYTTTAAGLAWLLWASFVREVHADPGTLLQSAQIQLSAAQRMTDGTERTRILDDVGEMLRGAEAGGAPMWMVHQLAGYLAFLRDDLRGAADGYRAARLESDCPEDVRERLLLREAGLRLESGAPEVALELLEAAGADGDAEQRTARNELRIRAWIETGDKDRAVREIVKLRAQGKDELSASVAGQLYERLEMPQSAEKAYRAGLGDEPVTNYYLARLKLRGGDVDTALRLLELSIQGDGATTRSLIRQERSTWKAVADDERFEEILGRDAIPAGPPPPAGN